MSDLNKQMYEFRERLKDEERSRYPLIRPTKHFGENGYRDQEFEMWWYKLPLRTKLRYKIKQWFGI